ncbi:hypothetical protein Tco_0390902 [Tanacetum coccineum]
MAKKSSFPAVDLSADDDNIEDEEYVVMATTAPTQTSVRWTRDEEKLLCEVWVGVFENSDIGNDRNEECFWGQIHDDFNKSTNGVYRTKNMITGKWNRMHPDCQKFRAIYKGITRKSGTQRITLTRRITRKYSVQMLGLDHRLIEGRIDEALTKLAQHKAEMSRQAKPSKFQSYSEIPVQCDIYVVVVNVSLPCYSVAFG